MRAGTVVWNGPVGVFEFDQFGAGTETVSYTHLRAHETVLDLVCRLLLEKKKKNILRLRYDLGP